MFDILSIGGLEREERTDSSCKSHVEIRKVEDCNKWDMAKILMNNDKPWGERASVGNLY